MRRAATALLPLLLSLGGCSVAVPRSNAGIAPFEEAPAGPVAVGAKYVGWIAGAPVTLALVPLGALAWATPWVDLPGAVDGVTAPAIGLGYAVEAVVGAPLFAATLPFAPSRTAEEDGVWRTRAWAPPGFVVEHAPAAPPRPAEPLPASVSARYAVPEAMARDVAARLDAALAARAGGEPATVPLDAGGPATLEVYLASEPGPRPLVLLTPPSEASFAARWLARRFARRGAHAAVVVRDERNSRGSANGSEDVRGGAANFLDPALDAAGVERKLRATVVAARAALGVLAARREVDPTRLSYLGISAGGIFGAVLLALEPRIARAVLIYPGGDLPALVATSEEPGVRTYRESWARRGVPPAALARAFAASVVTDPLPLARHVDPRRVLLFLSASDGSVPIAGGRALGRALGAPETWVLAGNHATSGLCFGFVLREADAFLFDAR